jgi:transcription-repair coupling factor (superfamily II helicase)
LLENAVRQMKQMPAKLQLDVNVDLPWPAYLPHDYVAGQKQRLEVYRRLARIRDQGKLEDFRQELRDRYGSPPEPAEWMLRLAEIRLLAARWHIENVHRDGRDIVLTYRTPKLMQKLAARGSRGLRVVDGKQAYWRPPSNETMELYQGLRELLHAQN